MGPVNHRKDFNIRAHIFLCITGMLFYRYLAWKCKHFHLSLRRLVEELEGNRLALVKEKTNSKVKLVVEEMNSKQARLFSQLDMEVYMEN
jgi:transposase